MAPDATAKTNSDVPAFTVKSVESIGLLGRDARWVAKVMNKSNWRPVGDESEATFENTNGIRMAYQIHRGRVIGARARFPEDALSADLTALSEYFVGNRGHFPFHWEARTRPKKTRRMGRFQHRDERYIYYRGILHTTGEPPFGPKEIEISLFPFENQTLMMDKHPDEHDSDAQDPGEVPTPE